MPANGSKRSAEPAGNSKEQRGRPFPKGVSGNPNGRPKVVGEIRELAREYTELALNTLVEIARESDRDAARVAAACAILDRGYGKPAQSVTVAGDKENPIRHEHYNLTVLTDDELDLLEKARARAAVVEPASSEPH